MANWWDMSALGVNEKRTFGEHGACLGVFALATEGLMHAELVRSCRRQQDSTGGEQRAGVVHSTTAALTFKLQRGGVV